MVPSLVVQVWTEHISKWLLYQVEITTTCISPDFSPRSNPAFRHAGSRVRNAKQWIWPRHPRPSCLLLRRGLLSFKEARSGRDLCAATNDPSLSLRTIGSAHSRANRDTRYPAAAAKSSTTIIGTCAPSWRQTMRIPRKHVM